MGRKRVRLDSKFESDKCAKIIYGENDRISHLPDEILVHILSSLSLKKAVGSSVLSSRWLNLWKHISCINIDAESSLDRITERYNLRHGNNRKWGKWVKWVTFCLGSHKAATLKAFKICSDLSQSDEEMITQWLKFALRRKIQILELDLSPKPKNRRYPSADYAFPNDFLTENNPSIDFKSLRSLSLRYVNVTNEDFHFFLRNCPLLEKLVIDIKPPLSNLQVCGQSLVLKHLDLSFRGFSLKSVKVSAPNLTLLTLPQLDELLLDYVPMLVELSVDYSYRRLEKLPPALSCCCFQLEILSLRLGPQGKAGVVVVVLSDFPALPKLKKLVIKYLGKGSFLELTPLLRKSPYLEEFVLELNRWRPLGNDGEVKNTMKVPHRHLKVFQVCGYYSDADGEVTNTMDVDLVRYILENCCLLEKIIIGPIFRYSSLNNKQAVNDCLKQQLEALVPQHIELVFL